MWLDHFLLAFAWIIYCTLHSMLAAIGTKNFIRQKIKAAYKFYRPAYVVFSFLGLISLLWWLIVLKSPRIYKQYSIVHVAGWMATIAGFGLMAVSIWRYFLSLSGLRSLVNESHTNQLIITGINRYMRHPLYLGTFIFIWGLWLLYPTVSFLLSNSIITIYTVLGIRLEEKKLVAEFGDQYKQYQKTVPKLWPRLQKRAI